MPPTPKHLHNTGVVDLTKPTTWTIKVTDTQGNEIGAFFVTIGAFPVTIGAFLVTIGAFFVTS